MSTMTPFDVRREPVGREVTGPTALGDDTGRLWRLAYTLARTDFKLKFYGSALGGLWQIMNPLMLFGVLFVVFSVGLGFSEGVTFYPEALLLGIVMFSFFNEVTSQAVRALMTRESLVRKVDFPRLAVPLATVLTAVFNLALNLVPVLVFYLAASGTPHVEWLAFPLVLVALVLLAFGLAMFLSVAFVRFRDIDPIWGVVTQMMFYASGVFFLLTSFPTWLRDIALCNPFAFLLAEGRHLFIDPASWKSPFSLMSTPWLAAVPIALMVLALVGGFLLFRREAPKVAEDL
jgi:ABC-2 type transport system permease protein